MKKVFSIAPSFNCTLSCEGCYLTTGVTKEMRDAVKSENYFLRAIEEAATRGYTEFAISWNPYPGAYEMTKKYIMHAKKLGMTTSTTTVLQSLDEVDIEFLENIDIFSISVDDMRFDSLSDFNEKLKYYKATRTVTSVLDKRTEKDESLDLISSDESDRIVQHVYSTLRSIQWNYNLLWTPKVFEWLFEDTENFRDMITEIDYPATIQHLIYKPLSIYESEEWFWQNYSRVVEDYPWVNIHGDEQQFIGDVALNNLLGISNCPGEDFQMIDIDPMGFARRCPENPDAYEVRTIAKLTELIDDGVPCRNDKCNCITS